MLYTLPDAQMSQHWKTNPKYTSEDHYPDAIFMYKHTFAIPRTLATVDYSPHKHSHAGTFDCKAVSPRAFAAQIITLQRRRLIAKLCFWVYGRAACAVIVVAAGRSEAQGCVCLGDIACVLLRSTIMGKAHEAQKL